MSTYPAKQTFSVRVADRDTGAEQDFDIKARSLAEAEQQASQAGWIVANPSGETVIDKESASLSDLILGSGIGRTITVSILRAFVIIFSFLVVVEIVRRALEQ